MRQKQNFRTRESQHSSTAFNKDEHHDTDNPYTHTALDTPISEPVTPIGYVIINALRRFRNTSIHYFSIQPRTEQYCTKSSSLVFFSHNFFCVSAPCFYRAIRAIAASSLPMGVVSFRSAVQCYSVPLFAYKHLYRHASPMRYFGAMTTILQRFMVYTNKSLALIRPSV
ncbi:YALIH222S02e05644g1_1 [Yarrowia lipolytica]|jgi:hypothetical protein|nr:YALIH222S02e05644g1_1 [Yarrowia lipolytica]